MFLNLLLFLQLSYICSLNPLTEDINATVKWQISVSIFPDDRLRSVFISINLEGIRLSLLCIWCWSSSWNAMALQWEKLSPQEFQQLQDLATCKFYRKKQKIFLKTNSTYLSRESRPPRAFLFNFSAQLFVLEKIYGSFLFSSM